MSETAMRVFFAINLDIRSTRRIADYSRQLQSNPAAPKASWVIPPKLHVTLKFLGEIDAELAPALGDAIRPIAASFGPLSISTGRLIGLPTTERARILAIEIDDLTRSLGELNRAIETCVEQLGFPAEPRVYRPHVTLARPRDWADLGPLFAASSPLPQLVSPVSEVVLYRSDLAHSGAEYTAVGRWPLRT